MTATEYPTIHNCNPSTREDETGRLVRQALEWADAGKLDQHDRGERAVLDALGSLEELLEGGAGERDDAASLSACTAAEEAVATRLVETRRWFLDAFAGERIDAPAAVAAMERIDWTDYYPVIDGSLRITGEWAYADSDDPTMLNYNNDAMISRADAAAACWKINADECSAEPQPAVEVEVGHASSIPGARWCRPVGWSPRNVIDGADWLDAEGSWQDDDGDAAGIVIYGDHAEGARVTVSLGDLRVATSGDCRVVGAVQVDFS